MARNTPLFSEFIDKSAINTHFFCGLYPTIFIKIVKSAQKSNNLEGFLSIDDFL